MALISPISGYSHTSQGVMTISELLSQVEVTGGVLWPRVQANGDGPAADEPLNATPTSGSQQVCRERG